MIDKDSEQMLTIINEVFDNIVEIFKKHNLTACSKVDFIITKVFLSFYANSILNVAEEDRKKYIQKRNDLLATEIAHATAAILASAGDFNNFEGVCACDKCKKRRDKETFGQTI